MKVLVIPDVHLKPHMFDRAQELMDQGTADLSVCLMDLSDSFGQQFNISLYEQTWDRAIRYQKDNPDTLWCYGNHDVSYVWDRLQSGYSAYAISTVTSKLNRLKSTLPSLDQIRFIHRIDSVLFAHGGLTEQFVRSYVEPSGRDSIDKVIRAVNKLPPDIMWQEESPIWFRPQYSTVPMYGAPDYVQVVGHTPVTHIEKRNGVISCDVFSTNRDGTPIGTCEYLVIDTVTGEFEGVR